MQMEAKETLMGRYWADNVTRPVLFLQALDSALRHCSSFGMAPEIGRHLSPRVPARETIREITGKPIPYSGTRSKFPLGFTLWPWLLYRDLTSVI